MLVLRGRSLFVSCLGGKVAKSCAHFLWEERFVSLDVVVGREECGVGYGFCFVGVCYGLFFVGGF